MPTKYSLCQKSFYIFNVFTCASHCGKFVGGKIIFPCNYPTGWCSILQYVPYFVKVKRNKESFSTRTHATIFSPKLGRICESRDQQAHTITISSLRRQKGRAQTKGLTHNAIKASLMLSWLTVIHLIWAPPPPKRLSPRCRQLHCHNCSFAYLNIAMGHITFLSFVTHNEDCANL